MNYISQIRAFYDALTVKQLSAGQISLWYALMDRNNRTGWVEWFTVANISLELSCGLSRRGIYDSRNALKQAGLIDFKSNGTKAASYKLTLLYFAQGTAQSAAQGTAQGTAQDTATLTKPKLKLKQNNTNILTVTDTDIANTSEWTDFVKMRLSIKKPLGDRAKQMVFDKLEELAPGDLELQKKILNQSVYHCWAGVLS